jgi:Bacterial Ig-like domain
VTDSIVHQNQELLSGTAEAGSAIKVYEGTTLLGTTMTGANGNWSATTSHLSKGSHTFVATATDASANTSPSSQPLDPSVGSHGAHHPAAAPTMAVYSADGSAGGAAAKSVTLDAPAAGTTNVHESSSVISDHLHAIFSAGDLDSIRHAFASSGSAIPGSTGNDMLTTIAGNDLFKGNGGHSAAPGPAATVAGGTAASVGEASAFGADDAAFSHHQHQNFEHIHQFEHMHIWG